MVDNNDGSENEEEVPEPSTLCCPVTQTMFRDPVFVPESGNTYERAALDTFWLTSSAAGAPPRDPLNNTVLTTKQVYTNWDKRREVHAWLQDHPNYVPKGWLSHDDMPSANAHTNVPNYPHAGIHHRHMHVELNLNLNLSARQLGIFCVVAIALILGSGIHELAHVSSPSSAASWAPAAEASAAINSALSAEAARANFVAFAREKREAPRQEEELAREQTLRAKGKGINTALPIARRYPMMYDSPVGSRVAVLLTRGGAMLDASGGEVEADTESMTVLVPVLPLGEMQLGNLASACLVLAFVFVWTRAASSNDAPFVFVLFSAPFWYTGGMLLRGALLPHFESTSLEVGAQHLVLSTSLLGYSRTSKINWPDLTNLQVHTKVIVNGNPQCVLAVREGVLLHEWGSSLSLVELKYVHNKVATFLESSIHELDSRTRWADGGGGFRVSPSVLKKMLAESS